MPSTMSTSTPAGAPDDETAAVFPFGEPDPRLEDYLDDKLQAAADLDTVDALLAAVAEQNRQLTAQLDDAAGALAAAQAAAAAERAQLRARLDEFAALEAAVAARLAAVNADDAAPEAVVRRLAGPLAQLQRVTLAHDYLVLVQEVAALAGAARGALRKQDDDPAAALAAASAALPPYARLRQLAARVAALQAAADAAAAHLVAHVGGVAAAVGADVAAAMRAAFAALLAQRGWPARVDAGVRADATWRDGFARLVALQAVTLGEETATTTTTKTPTPTLLPIAVMADLFVKEFRYHFLSADSGRQTSDPRQIADVCFPWFLARVDAWAAFLRASFADLLAQQPPPFADKTAVYTDPACAFVAALLPAMQDKVQQTAAYAVQLHQQTQATAAAAAAAATAAAAAAAAAAGAAGAAGAATATGEPAGAGTDAAGAAPAVGGPSFLSSFIVQLLAFDDALRTRYGYDGGCAGGPAAWPGLAGAVLDEHFGLWLQAEKDYTLARYREIVGGGGPSSGASSAATRAIDYDYNGPGKTKPTLAAVRVMDLLRGVTAQYARVRAFGQRLRFLMDIQVTVLDAYDARLGDALEAYYAMTSAVARTLHGVSREQRAALEGTGALEALCRVYGSADHVVRTLRDWGDDAFFVQLHDDLETRAAAAAAAAAHADLPGGGGGGGGDKNNNSSSNQVRQRMAAAARRDSGDRTPAGGHADGSLFDETMENFGRRRATAQEFLVTALAAANRKAFRPYVLRTHWTPVAAEADTAAAAASPADLAVTPELDEPLRVLDRNLGFLARALGTAALRRTVRSAAEQLQDLLWREVLMAQHFTALGAAQFARDVGAVAAVVEQHGGGGAALAGLREAVRLLTLPMVGGDITLLQASDRVFTDNAEARRLLQELGLALLTTANARLILQRRVEISA